MSTRPEGAPQPTGSAEVGPGAGPEEQVSARWREDSSKDSSEAGAGADDSGTAPPPTPARTAGPGVDWEDRARRALADLDNVRKRQGRDLATARAEERARVAAAWLPVLDSLDRALGHSDADEDPVAAGVRAVRDQAVGVLSALGYPRHEEVGVPFDPVRHEVVSVVDEPSVAAGTVVEVLRPGYGDGPDQLRPAAVAVSRRPE